MSHTSPKQDGFDVMEFISNHWVQMVLGVIILIFLVFMFIGFSSSENLGEVFYLNQMTMENADPTYFKYTGRDRDVLGESGEDYYLQNLTFANSGSANQLLDGNKPFVNQTNYLDMPAQYRPKPLSGMVGQSGNVVAQEKGPEGSV